MDVLSSSENDSSEKKKKGAFNYKVNFVYNK